MELPALIAVLVDAILLKCPQYDRASVTVALEAVFAGHPALLGGNTISMLFGQNNDFTNAMITIGDVHAGNQVHVTVQLPQPIDPLPAALAALASIPLTDVPAPRSDLPQASRLPFESSPHFVGREMELKALAQAIGTAQPTVVMPAVATGLGGIGKTSLVTEFAYRYGVYFHGGVFWLNCADPNQVASQIAACTVDLGIDPTGMAFDEQVQRVLHAWKSPMPRLLIFDNCKDRAILKRWKPTVGGCRVLVTSRSDQWPTFTQVRLGLLSLAESRALLQAFYTELTDAEADLIATDLGHLPLALHLAGNYLNLYRPAITAYLNALSIAHESLQGHGAFDSPTEHEQNVEATFMVSFNQLDPTKAIDALALVMLDGAAWCAHGVPIPRDLVLTFVPDETTQAARVDALRRLHQLGLLDGTDAVVLHRLLAQVVQAKLGSTETLAVVEDRIVAAASRANDTRIPNSMMPLESHVRHATMRALDRDDARAALLANSLGFFENLRGDYDAAQELLERVLEINEMGLRVAYLETARSLHNLSMVLCNQGRLTESERLSERALALYEPILGISHPETAYSLSNLAFLRVKQGRYDEAQELYKRVLEIWESTMGLEHPNTAAGLNNLASVMDKQGQYKEAQALYERALMIRRMTLGVNHPDTAGSLNNLASIMLKQGLYRESQGLFEEALIVRETTLGAHHPDTAMSVNNLAFALERQGRYREAQGLFERALAVRETVLGVDHPDTVENVISLAGVLESQERYGEAQPLYKRAWAVRKAVLGADHPDTVTTISNLNSLITVKEYVLPALLLNNFAVLLASQGCYKDVQPIFEQALALYEPLFRLHHPYTTTVIENMVCLLMLQDRSIEAIGLIERACILYEQSIGRDHEMTNRLRMYSAELKGSIQLQ